MRIHVQEAAFDAGLELNRFTEPLAQMGAVVSFTGVVRDTAQNDLSYMHIEHYPGMTEKALTEIGEQAMSRWGLGDVLIIHRFGKLAPNEQIMMVATAAAHRKSAFEAADFLMDYLKSRAPFWKKEHTSSSADWVSAKQDDEAALRRW